MGWLKLILIVSGLISAAAYADDPTCSAAGRCWNSDTPSCSWREEVTYGSNNCADHAYVVCLKRRYPKADACQPTQNQSINDLPAPRISPRLRHLRNFMGTNSNTTDTNAPSTYSSPAESSGGGAQEGPGAAAQ